VWAGRETKTSSGREEGFSEIDYNHAKKRRIMKKERYLQKKPDTTNAARKGD